VSKLHRRTFLADTLSGAAAAALLGGPATAFAQIKSTPAPPATALPPGIKTFSKVPTGATEVANAHLNARGEGVEFLQKGEPLELTGFALKLTKRDDAVLKNGKVPNPSTRRFMLSVGIELLKEDQARLPTLSKERIIDYLNSNYVSVQARVQKDSKGNQYLHHRCIVATGSFRGAKLSDDFQPAVANAVKEIHSLGIYLPPKVQPTTENLRTAVMIHKHTGIDAASVKAGNAKTEAQYEYIFLRGKQSAAGGKLDLYCFITSDERTKLHYIKPGQRPPTKYSDATLKAQVYFTKYVDSGLVPAESVARNQTVNSQATFLMSDVDAFARNKLGQTDAFANLNQTLDAIIDGTLKPSSKVPSSTGSPSSAATTTSSAAAKVNVPK
jgi:hypothetical protein